MKEVDLTLDDIHFICELLADHADQNPQYQGYSRELSQRLLKLWMHWARIADYQTGSFALRLKRL